MNASLAVVLNNLPLGSFLRVLYPDPAVPGSRQRSPPMFHSSLHGFLNYFKTKRLKEKLKRTEPN